MASDDRFSMTTEKYLGKQTNTISSFMNKDTIYFKPVLTAKIQLMLHLRITFDNFADIFPICLK